jgi:hypothetical protein
VTGDPSAFDWTPELPFPVSKDRLEGFHQASSGVDPIEEHHHDDASKNLEAGAVSQTPGASGTLRAGDNSAATDMSRQEEPQQSAHVVNACCVVPSCGRMFHRQSDLQRHIKGRHMPGAAFWCSYDGCGRSQKPHSANKPFPRKDKRDEHVRKVHKDAAIVDLQVFDTTTLKNKSANETSDETSDKTSDKTSDETKPNPALKHVTMHDILPFAKFLKNWK